LPAQKRERSGELRAEPRARGGRHEQSGRCRYYENVVAPGAEPQAAANWVMTEALADAKDYQDSCASRRVALAHHRAGQKAER